MSLNSSSCASSLSSAMSSLISALPSHTDFGTIFSSTYKSYSTAGVLSSGGGVAGTENESPITTFINGLDNRTSTPHDFAVVMANYWATCLKTPVAPATALVNDAASKVSAFEAAINASYVTTESTPHYQTFIQNMENVAKTIIWTVTLSVSPYVRTETVS